MKSAIYFEDGFAQIVLTPESDQEKAALGLLEEGRREIAITRGEFFMSGSCYMRFHADGSYTSAGPSTILVLKPAGPT